MISIPQELSIRRDSDFKEFEKCPTCHIDGRKPVLARYTDGHAYCFWCGHYEPASLFKQMDEKFSCIPYVEPKKVLDKTELPPLSRQDRIDRIPHHMWNVKALPDKANLSLGLEAKLWLKSYGIQDKEVKKHGLLWDDDRQWLIFPYRSASKQLLGWQARCFDPVSVKRGDKWFTFGPKSEIMYYVGLEKANGNDIIIVVEDIISAIKVGRQWAALPLFGSVIGLGTLTRLAVPFQKIGVWLDRDKAAESRHEASRAAQYIKDVFPIITEKDPKQYSDIDIFEIIRDRL